MEHDARLGASGHSTRAPHRWLGHQKRRALAAPSGVYTKREHKQSSEDLKYVADEWLVKFEWPAASTRPRMQLAIAFANKGKATLNTSARASL